MGVTVKIVGLIVTFVGQGRRHALARPDDGTIDKFKRHVEFDVTQPPATLRSFETAHEHSHPCVIATSAAARFAVVSLFRVV